MQEVTGEVLENEIKLVLSGRIDSNNAPAFEQGIQKYIEGKKAVPVTIDAAGLSYISSAGLRVLLHLMRTNPDIRVLNVQSEVYEILDMTGFSQMMKVEKACRVISPDDLEPIGKGAKGSVFRIDSENIVKICHDVNARENIRQEREKAKLALVLGIPTAISYDIVKVGDRIGAVFELLNARSFSKILADDPDQFDWCVQEFADLLKKIHSTEVPEGKLPDVKEKVLNTVNSIRDKLPEDAWKKLNSLVQAVPADNHMIHGDFQTNNVELQDGEALLIDMDTLSVGYPIFEFGFMYDAFVGFGECDPEEVREFLGFDSELSKRFWRKVLSAYLGTEEEKYILKLEDKARIVGYPRLIDHVYRHKLDETETGRVQIETWKNELLELLGRTDTLMFLRNELEIDADIKKLPEVLSFVERHLEESECSLRSKLQINVAVEEIFVNIATYAYSPDSGMAKVRVEVSEDPVIVNITFIDNGMPFDPLAKDDPDVTLPASSRGIGGLGIFMTKKTMDDVAYEYKDGHNILRLKKNL